MPVFTARAIIQLSLDGEFIAEFPSAKKASLQFGGKHNMQYSIHNAASISAKVKTYKGYKWAFKEESTK